jgi:hypothetical protein
MPHHPTDHDSGRGNKWLPDDFVSL